MKRRLLKLNTIAEMKNSMEVLEDKVDNICQKGEQKDKKGK